MKKSLILLLTIFLSSCKDIVLPKIENHERCVSLIERVEDAIIGKCRCHEYEVSERFIGRISESYDMPIEYCSKRVSFTARVWSDEYIYFFDEVFFMKENSRRKARRK